MSETAQTGFYGMRAALNDELVALARSGDSHARAELANRLPEQLSRLLDLYLVVHQQHPEHAFDALSADLGRLRAAA